MSLRWKQLGLLAKHHAQPRAKGWRADGSEADPFRARLLAGLSDLKDSHILQDKVIDLEDEPLPMPIPTPEPEVQKPLLIYDRADGQQQLSALTMYSAHALPLGPNTFPSAAHLLECAHYNPEADAQIFNLILSASTGHDARLVGSMYEAYQRSVWTAEKTVEIMRGIMSIKLAFYPPLVELLLATGDTQIWDASDPEDSFWCIGKPNSHEYGQNHFGQILMDIRARLRKEREHGFQDVVQSILAILPQPETRAPSDSDRQETPSPQSPVTSIPSSPVSDRPIINPGTRPRLVSRQLTQPRPAQTAPTPRPPSAANTRPPVQLPAHFLADPAWKEWADYQNANGGQDKILQVVKEAAEAQRAEEQTLAQTQAQTNAMQNQAQSQAAFAQAQNNAQATQNQAQIAQAQTAQSNAQLAQRQAAINQAPANPSQALLAQQYPDQQSSIVQNQAHYEHLSRLAAEGNVEAQRPLGAKQVRFADGSQAV